MIAASTWVGHCPPRLEAREPFRATISAGSPHRVKEAAPADGLDPGDGAPAFALAAGPPDDEGLALDEIDVDGSPDPGVGRVVAVVAHAEDVAGGNRVAGEVASAPSRLLDRLVALVAQGLHPQLATAIVAEAHGFRPVGVGTDPRDAFPLERFAVDVDR